jgi:hypothetical protein
MAETTARKKESFLQNERDFSIAPAKHRINPATSYPDPVHSEQPGTVEKMVRTERLTSRLHPFQVTVVRQ